MRLTFEENVAHVSAQLDDILKQRLDAMAARLLAQWNPDGEHGTDDGRSPWRRVSMSEMLELQRARDREWKAETMIRVRHIVRAEYDRQRQSQLR
jgi:hypothetical protein